MLLMVMLFSMMASFVFMLVLSRSASQAKANALARARVETTSMRTMLEMVFSDATVCQSNLNSRGLGASVSELTQKATEGNIELFAPSSSKAVLAKDSQFNLLVVQSISMTPPVAAVAAENSFFSELRVAVRSLAAEGGRQMIRIPFLFVADAGGQFTRCYASTYPRPDDPRLFALEDHLCRGRDEGENTIFRPGERFCDSDSKRLIKAVNP